MNQQPVSNMKKQSNADSKKKEITTLPSSSSSTTPKPSLTQTPPTRQIRASFTESTITVYQAYNDAIADAALSTQRLDASPQYRPSRATWIKPSWTWMMYRSNYSHKDANQARILALHMTHEAFISLLRTATLANQSHSKGQGVIIQWDPERGPRLERREWRSIQIGIMGKARETWIREGIVKIEDFTRKARELKRVVDAEAAVGMEDLVERELLVREEVFEVPDDVRVRLAMD